MENQTILIKETTRVDEIRRLFFGGRQTRKDKYTNAIKFMNSFKNEAKLVTETEKAVLAIIQIKRYSRENKNFYYQNVEMWLPKSLIIKDN